MHIEVLRSDRRLVAPHVCAAALQRYQNVFPHRYLAWNAPQQCFEIRQKNKINRQDDRITFIAEYDNINQRRVPVPFDHEWVDSSLEGNYLMLKLGNEGLQKFINEENAKLRDKRADEAAQQIADMHLYLKSAFKP